jgi:hypothetical protein
MNSHSDKVVSPAVSTHTGVVGVLAIILVGLGFAVGYGYHTVQSAPSTIQSPDAETVSTPPLVKGLRVSPDDRLVAFAAVFDQSRRAARFVFDLKTNTYTTANTPRGWQDYITQWSANGRAVLFEREKIPRPVDDTTAGIYQEKVWLNPGAPKQGAVKPQTAPPQLMTEGLAPRAEKVVAGFWAPNGQLIIKTRRETKSLYAVRGGVASFVDHSSGTYEQNRAITENGKPVYYVVRDISGAGEKTTGDTALFRVENAKAQQISDALEDPTWVYVAENARWMIACRQADNGTDWIWTLYSVAPHQARRVRSAQVPGDVIAVYWSPDFKHVLGAAGQSLWLIDVPSLHVHRLGARMDWSADDAAWMNRENAVVVASAGRLWRVALPHGAQRELWKLPPAYWR